MIAPQSDLIAQLMEQFSIPKDCKFFHITVTRNAPVVVSCIFNPPNTTGEYLDIEKNYKLVEIKC